MYFLCLTPWNLQKVETQPSKMNPLQGGIRGVHANGSVDGFGSNNFSRAAAGLEKKIVDRFGILSR